MKSRSQRSRSKAKGRPAGARSSREAEGAELEAVFQQLKRLLEPYLDRCRATERRGYYALESASLVHRGRPLWFAGVRTGKNYVSFYLMPVYAVPGLKTAISPELRKRMQGKSCFNFARPDPALFRELAKLTAAGAEKYLSEAFLARLASGGWKCE